MNTTERHFHHFGQVLHRRKRLLSKCIKIRVARWSSLWSLLFHPSLGTIIFLNHDNELCKKTEGKTPVTYPLAGKTKHPKRNFTVVHVNFFNLFFIPSAPILPSPSVSPAPRKALVSASFRTRAPDLKFWRNSLQTEVSSEFTDPSSHWLRHAIWLQRVQFGYKSTKA